jgi:hypothetical protein
VKKEKNNDDFGHQKKKMQTPTTRRQVTGTVENQRPQFDWFWVLFDGRVFKNMVRSSIDEKREWEYVGLPFPR